MCISSSKSPRECDMEISDYISRFTGVFDTEWYLVSYQDVNSKGVHPLLHYIQHGFSEGCRPNPLFDTLWYLDAYPEVRATGENPLAHYLRFGVERGLRPNPLFDTLWYLGAYPEVVNSHLHPLAHYLRHGHRGVFQPNPLFDTDWYLSTYPEVHTSGMSPLQHYLEHAFDGNFQPNPLFDTDWYLSTYPEVHTSGMSPLQHYLEHAFDGNFQPNPLFNNKAYIEHFPDLCASGSYPLRHYLLSSENFCSGLVQLNHKEQPSHRLLYMDSVYPRPKADSGSLDAINFMTLFLKMGFSITYIATAEFFANNFYRHSLEDIGIECVDYVKFKSVESFIETCGCLFDVFFLSRVYCGGHFYEQIRKLVPKSKIIFNTVDLHHVREEREARLQQNRVALNRSYWTREREYYLSRMCDATIVASDREAELLHREVPGAQVYIIPLLRELPGRDKEFALRSGVGFIGGYRHSPNVDAVNYLLDFIWPHVVKLDNSIILYIMGADLPDDIKSRNDINVKFVGYVDDIQQSLSTLRLMVAPLRYGAGAKGKIVSSLAHGVPCVATSIAIEGMNLNDGRDIVVADDPELFARKICDLHHNEDAWYAFSDNGYLSVLEKNDIGKGENIIIKILREIGLKYK